ncbi:MAG: hypothetical protein ACFHX7_14535 [Pseudomonadota bacterium]
MKNPAETRFFFVLEPGAFGDALTYWPQHVAGSGADSLGICGVSGLDLPGSAGLQAQVA